jgi:RNA polymerase sigma-70 factor (ECF subfamily)
MYALTPQMREGIARDENQYVIGQPLRVCVKSAKYSSSVPQGQNGGDGITPDQFKTDLIGLLPRMKRFALSLTRSGPDADDLLQEACSAALQKWAQYDPSQPLDRWMFRIIRNLWIDEVRKRRVRTGEGQVPAEDAVELQSTSDIETEMTAQQVRGHVSALPPELGQPLLLVCAEGFSYSDVAEMLDIPIGTVMSRIHRARKLLVARLSDAKEPVL